jgi:ribonuclease P protein component
MAPVASPMILSARILKKRADFLRAKAGGRVPTQAFTMQYIAAHEEAGCGVGYTCAKRTFITGVASNRGRRRLKAAWQQVTKQQPSLIPQGFYLVLVGKPAVLEIDYAYLVKDLEKALTTLKDTLKTQNPPL